jgi:hypothetical protein
MTSSSLQPVATRPDGAPPVPRSSTPEDATRSRPLTDRDSNEVDATTVSDSLKELGHHQDPHWSCGCARPDLRPCAREEDDVEIVPVMSGGQR